MDLKSQSPMMKRYNTVEVANSCCHIMNVSSRNSLPGMVRSTVSTYGHHSSTNASFSTIANNLSFTTALTNLPNYTSPNPKSSFNANDKESQTSLVIRFFLTALIFALIVIGNSLTIHVVRNNRNLTSIKNYYYGYYIVNLSISDLLVGLVCLPTTILYYIFPGRWLFGLFLCKLFPTLQIIVVSASISTLTVITFERFSAIVHPLQPRSTLRKLKFKIAAIWVWSTIIALPSFIAYQINSEQLCVEKGISQWYTIMLFLVNYAVPLTFIFLTYLRMLYELRRQSSTGSKRELAAHKRFIKLAIILVLSFAICYLPSNIVFFVFEYTVVKIDQRTLATMLQYFHLLIWFNSCLNPFIYGSVDTYFKRGFKKTFGLGSSCDSQDKTTNLSRMSTFKSERPSPAVKRWQHQDSPSSLSVRSSNNDRTVRFQPLASQRRDSPSCKSKSILNNNLNKQSLINEKGYVSLVLYQSKNGSNYDLTESDHDETKELFVDLSTPSSPMVNNFVENAGIDSEIKNMFLNVQFLKELHHSRETHL